MGLRPARTVRVLQGQPWTRISSKKPRKSYVKGAPRPRVRQYNMGVDQYYDVQVDLICDDDVQLRDNSMESARQVAVKYLEKHLPNSFFFGILKYPHFVIREHSALGVAGADRISKGMKRAFGKPKGRLARIHVGNTVFRVRVARTAVPTVLEAFKRAKVKMSGSYRESVKDITDDAFNRSKIGKVVVMKKKEEEKPKPEEEKKEEAPAKEGEAKAAEATAGKEEKGAAAAGEKKEEKKAEKK